jgi:glucan biosynthesis protein C
MRKINRRNIGLDNWRAILVIVGVCHHAAINSDGWWQLVGVASHKFRMEAFFAISGITAAYTIRNRDVETWLTKRLFSLLIPTIFAGIFLNIPTGIINTFSSQARIGQDISFPDHISFPILHLWFMPVIVFCSAVLAFLFKFPNTLLLIENSISTLFAEASSLKRYLSLLFAVWMFGFLALIIDMLLAHICFLLSDANRSVKVLAYLFSATAGRTPYYLIFYMLGWSALRYPAMYKAISSHNKFSAFIVSSGIFILILSYMQFGDIIYPYRIDNFSNFYALYNNAVKLFMAPCCVFLIIFSVNHMKDTIVYSKNISDASYSIYIVHILIISLIDLSFGSFGIGTSYRYASTSVISILSSYLVHVRIVKKYPAMTYLINGKGEFSKIFMKLPNNAVQI